MILFLLGCTLNHGPVATCANGEANFEIVDTFTMRGDYVVEVRRLPDTPWRKTDEYDVDTNNIVVYCDDQSEARVSFWGHEGE